MPQADKRSTEYHGQQQQYDDEINLLELLQVLLKRSGMIIKVTLVAAVFSVVYALLQTNIYTATSRLLPPQKDSGGGAAALLGQLGGLAGMAGGLGGGSGDLYIAILKSRSVTDAVIEKLGLAVELEEDNPDILRSKVQDMLQVSSGKSDGIITISADNKEPEKAALLVNTFVTELQRKSTELNLSKAGTERNFLDKRLQVIRQDLKAAEDDLKTFQEKYKTIKADTQAEASIEGIARLKAELVSQEVKLAALRHSMTDEAPEVKTQMVTISRLRSQINSMSGGSFGGDSEVIPNVGSAPGIGVEYVRKLREFKLQEALFEQLSKQYELAKLNEARDSSALQVLDEATVPTQKSKPRRSLICIVITMLGFMMAIFWAFVSDFFAKMPQEDAAAFIEIKESFIDSVYPFIRWLPFIKKG
ncbi:MAG: Wzz/FepE/Etk N-terminal domain-containing protein [Trichlorobacter sp.]|nr:Wzz/FepE/Etk N-terminal domain-containing protein [Trichlorobacter sp.]